MADKKIIVILGPTCSGKSDLAVRIAKKFNGEVISADSRQVYKGMDIGTGKITKKEMRGVPHHLLDVASPKSKFTVVQYRNMAQGAIGRILKKGRVPIICGGAAFYIYALIDGIIIPKVKPDWRLRQKLEKLSTDELLKKLEKLDPRRAQNIERQNRRRLIRALEIIIKTKKPVPTLEKKPLPYLVLIIGIKKSPAKLKEAIHKRLVKRLKQGMIAEVKNLFQSGISWKRLEDFGLEYRWLVRYLRSELKNISFQKTVFFLQLQKDIERFSKRQMTWFKRDERIFWIEKPSQALKLLRAFLR